MEAHAAPAKLAAFEALDSRGDEGWMQQYGSWLRQAATHRQGLMVFTH